MKKIAEEMMFKRIFFFLLNLSAFGFRQVFDRQNTNTKLGTIETIQLLLSRGWQLGAGAGGQESSKKPEQ